MPRNALSLPGGARPPGRLLEHGAALLLLLVGTLLTVHAARVVEPTADESKYVNAGRLVIEEGWREELTRYQGPICLWANQLLHDRRTTPLENYDRAQLLPSRLGTLPFFLLGALVVWRWARRTSGAAGGLLALGALTLHPLWIGYGALALVDVPCAALVVLSLAAAAWHGRAPGARRLGILGVTLGLALATKYSAPLFLAPAAVLALVREARGAGADRTGGRRLGPALARLARASLWLGGTTLAALYASYGFAVGPALGSGWEPASSTLRTLLGTPVAGTLASLLPLPWLQGVDFQKTIAERTWSVFLDGTFAAGHATYYLRALLYKTPDVLVLLFLVAVVGRPLLAARRGRSVEGRERELLSAVLPGLALGLGYLGLGSSLQLGVRYALPALPLLALLVGTAGPLLARLRPRPLAHGVAALLALLALAPALAGRADPIGTFNRASGGQRLAFRHLRDTSCDFGQVGAAGAARLVERAGPDARPIASGTAARFGLLVADCRALSAASRLDASRPDLAWLETGRVLDHERAGAWLFEVTPERFEAAVERDPDDAILRRDLALAWLAAGEMERASAHLALLPDELGEGPRRVERALAAHARSPEGEAVRELAAAWEEVGRPDLVTALIEAHPDLWSPKARLRDLVQARVAERDLAGAAALLREADPAVRRGLARSFLLLAMRLESPAEVRALAAELAEDDPALRDLAGIFEDMEARHARVREVLLRGAARARGEPVPVEGPGG